MTAIRGRSWPKANVFWLSVGITLAGAILRLYLLGARSVWFDEAIEVVIARAPLSQQPAVSLAFAYGDPPLYSWLLHFALKVGSTEIVWRLPSALSGTLAVAASYRLFRLWVDAPAALLAQALFAVAPMQVYHSQEVNQYALLVAFSVLIYWLYERALRQPGVRRMILFGLMSVVGIFTHYGCMWLVAALALTVLFRMKPRNWWRWWPAGLIIGLGMAVLYFTVIQAQIQVMRGVVPGTSSGLHISLAADLPDLGWRLLNSLHFLTDVYGGIDVLASVATVFFGTCLLLGLLYTVARLRQWALAGLLLMPLLVSYLAYKSGLYFWGQRYLLFASPLVYLFIGSGLSVVTRPGRVWHSVPIVALVVLAANQVYTGFPNEMVNENLRPVVQAVVAKQQPDDGIYVYYGARPAFLVYYQGAMDNVKFGRWFRGKPLADKLTDIQPWVNEHPKWWFVASHMSVEEVNAILAELDRQCKRTDTVAASAALAAHYDCGQLRQ